MTIKLTHKKYLLHRDSNTNPPHFGLVSTGSERKEETWPVPAHSCVLVCCRALISGASPHRQPCELFILAMELFVFSNVAFLQNHIEQEYCEKDGITEDAIYEFVIQLGEDDDDSSSSDSSDDPSDPESDEELAVPLPMDTDTSTENKMFSK
ncbi:hypothetical protein J6590_080228 [Homalodisca vitripennis]|nr:hypothetical protein J6590_080228 [Homalodisca vitripennis]